MHSTKFNGKSLELANFLMNRRKLSQNDNEFLKISGINSKDKIFTR